MVKTFVVLFRCYCSNLIFYKKLLELCMRRGYKFAINLHWFHNNASKKNNSLNGNSSEPIINE